MILPLHIVIALLSVTYTTYTFFHPSNGKLKSSYALVAATLLSGTYLALHNMSHILEVCTVGLAYTIGISLGLAAIHRKLSATSHR